LNEKLSVEHYKHNLQCWKAKFYEILEGKDFKLILSSEEQKRNDIVPLFEYLIEQIHNSHDLQQAKLNKNILL